MNHGSGVTGLAVFLRFAQDGAPALLVRGRSE
jgi:hypothetical protein